MMLITIFDYDLIMRNMFVLPTSSTSVVNIDHISRVVSLVHIDALTSIHHVTEFNKHQVKCSC